MAEIGVATSVISLIQISKHIILACKDYYKTAKGANKAIVEVITIVTDLKSTLDTIEFLLDTDCDTEDPRLPLLKSLDASFKACRTALEEVATQLGIKLDTDLKPDNVKVSFQKKATWPWREKDVNKILQTIEKYKTTFILALNGDTLKVILAIQDNVQTMVIGEKHNKILEWLKLSIEPSTNHNAARKKHEPTTGDWLLESELFTAWTKATNASLWLHGLPGAGKTILCSTIIEHVKSLCTNDSVNRYAYFYFDFSDTQKQSVTGMLRSIVAQLSVPELPTEVEELYKKCNHGHQQPDQENLITTLISLLKNLHPTYLIMDALDECSERKVLLKVIRRIIQTQSTHVNVLVTSREEQDIKEGMQGVISNIISLECDGLDADIERHIQKCLENDMDWQNCGPNIRQEIQDALVKGAHGM